jgi:GntR family transcriptional repressor for pyruvate dehydrogenase complex
MFEPVTEAGIPDSIIKQVKSLISTGKLQPWDRLPGERQLMKELQVSRSSLRQALQALESIGYVKTISGKGTYVQDPSDNAVTLLHSIMLPWAEGNEKQLSELLEVRLVLEMEAAALAAERASKEDLELIHSALENIINAHQSRQLNYMVTANIAFHRSIVQATGNSLMVTIIDSIGTAMRDLSSFALRITGGLPESVDEHRRIFEAITAGNSKAARAEIEKHIRGVAEILHASEAPDGMSKNKTQTAEFSTSK